MIKKFTSKNPFFKTGYATLVAASKTYEYANSLGIYTVRSSVPFSTICPWIGLRHERDGCFPLSKNYVTELRNVVEVGEFIWNRDHKRLDFPNKLKLYFENCRLDEHYSEEDENVPMRYFILGNTKIEIDPLYQLHKTLIYGPQTNHITVPLQELGVNWFE